MTARLSTWTVVALLLTIVVSLRASAQAPTVVSADPDPEYTKVLNQRADDVIAALKIEGDADKAARVRETLIAQYRAVRDVHDGREAKLKSIPREDKAQIDRVKADAEAAIKPLHDEFLAKLGKDLTPEQVEIVKDKMTMGRLKHDWGGFTDMLPELTDAQKEHILAQLKEAREIAMDKGSSKEKHAVFDKYRGRINNYLSKQGYDLKKASKEWAERRKAREAGAKQAATTKTAN